jgi:hypothetical protein
MDARIRLAETQANALNTAVANTAAKTPVFGGPERDAINAVVDKSVQNICERISTLHAALDEIQQEALERNAQIKLQLTDHVSISVKINDEITHMQAVIAELRASTPSRK